MLTQRAEQGLFLLYSCALCHGLLEVPCIDMAQEDFRSMLAENLEMKIYKAGDEIVLQGHPQRCGVLLLCGCAMLEEGQGDDRHLLDHVRGPAWAEICSVLRIREEAFATVRAVTNCAVGLLSPETLADLYQCDLRFKRNLEELGLHVLNCYETKLDREALQLSDLPEFKDCSPAMLKHLQGCLKLECCGSQTTILQEGSKDGSKMYFVQEGEVRILEGETDAGGLGRGAILGAHVVLGVLLEHSTSCQSQTVCQLKSLARADVLEGIRKFPQEGEWFRKLAKLPAQDMTVGMSLLANIPCFAQAQSGFFDLLTSSLKPCTFFADQPIFEQGDPGESMVALMKGSVRIEINGEALAARTAPDIFGEMAILEGSNRVASVIADSCCDAATLSRDDLLDAFTDYPEVKLELEALVERRQNLEYQGCLTSIMEMHEVTHAESLWFFKESDKEFLKLINAGIQKRQYCTGKTIMRQGDKGDSVMMLQSGLASVTANGSVVGEIRPGNVLGEMGLLAESPVRSATVTTLQTCVVLEIPRDVVLSAFEVYPAEKARFEEIIGHRRAALESLSGTRANAESAMRKGPKKEKLASGARRATRRDSQLDVMLGALRLATDPGSKEKTSRQQRAQRQRAAESKECESSRRRQQMEQYLQKRKYQMEAAEMKRVLAVIRSGKEGQIIPENHSYIDADLSLWSMQKANSLEGCVPMSARLPPCESRSAKGDMASSGSSSARKWDPNAQEPCISGPFATLSPSASQTSGMPKSVAELPSIVKPKSQASMQNTRRLRGVYRPMTRQLYGSVLDEISTF